MAQEVLDKKKADVVFVGRQFLANPNTVVQFSEDLGVQVKRAIQMEWVFLGRGTARPTAKAAR